MAVLSYRACLCALSLISLTACELVREPMAVQLTEDRVAVHAVLVAGDTTAAVLLSLIPATADLFGPPEWIPVADAQVRLTRGSDTLVLTVDADTTVNPCFAGPLHNQSPARELRPGCYTARVPGGVVSGAEFGLLIDLPGHGRVEGRTIVPTAPTILEPQAGTILPQGQAGEPTFHVEWTPLEDARAAELRLGAREDACTVYISAGSFVHVESRILLDVRSVDIGAAVQCTEPTDPVPADIVVTAFDAAYSRYLEVFARNRPMSDAALGISGPAIGVFGSAASARQPVSFSADLAPDI